MPTLKSKDILEVLPIWKIEQDIIISVHGDLTLAFSMSWPEVFSLSANVDMVGETRMESGDFREMNELLVKAISVLPENSIVHQQDWFTEEQYAPSFEVEGYLDKASEQHFNQRPYLTHRSFVYITRVNPSRAEVGSLKTTLLRGRPMPKALNDRQRIEEFISCIDQYVSIITSTKKVGMTRLRGKQLCDPEGVGGLLERYLSLSMEEEVVPLSDVQIDGDITVGDKHVKFFSVSDIDDMTDVVFTHNYVSGLSSENSRISVCFPAPVGLMLNVNHVYNQYIFKADKLDILPKMEKRAQQMKGLGSFAKVNAVNAALIDDYLTTQAYTGYPPVRCHMNVMVWTNDKTQMSRIRNLTTSAVSKMGIRPRENASTAALLFWAGIPGAASELPAEEQFWTFLPQAACLLHTETNNTRELSTYGVKVVDRLSGKPILVDFSDAPVKAGWTANRNKFILGPSGSGKSFLTNHFLRSYYTQGAHIVIVDVGDSYEGICQMLGGKYLTYQANNPITFNPFFIQGRFKPDIEKLEAIKSLLYSLWKKTDEGSTRLEDTTLALSVTGYFDYLEKNLDVFPCFNTFYEYLRREFKVILTAKGVTMRHFDYDAFMLVMEPFYRGGEYDYLLNSETNLDLTKERFVVFELDNIKDNKILFPVVTIVIMDTFITKMRQLKGIRKIILIEEAWKAIMKEEMAEYIKYLYKTVRKHFGEAWIVTQEVDDIISSPIVKDSIINNADVKILMDQRKYQNKFDAVRQFLALTKQEANLALSLNRDNDARRKYKEFFVSFGGQKAAVYGLEVSVPEYFAYTTEQSEKVAVHKQVQLAGGNYEVGLREHVDSLSDPVG